jgi:hypothetical protein
MLHVFILMLHMLQWLYTYVSSIWSKCFTCFRRILQVFYLDVAYVAVVIHICCKCMFHLVSVCCNRCCSPRYLTRGQAHATLGAPSPPGMVPHSGACSRLNACACALCSLPLSHWARALYSLSFSHIGVRALWSLSLVSGHVCCALSHWGTHAMFSLSHIAGRAHAHALSSRRNIVGGGVRCSSSRRRHVFKKKARGGAGHIRCSTHGVSAAAYAGVRSRRSVRMSWR